MRIPGTIPATGGRGKPDGTSKERDMAKWLMAALLIGGSAGAGAGQGNAAYTGGGIGNASGNLNLFTVQITSNRA